MENKRYSVDQRINGQRTYQRTTEVVPSSAKIYVNDNISCQCPVKTVDVYHKYNLKHGDVYCHLTL
jgi:hypothetical protein